MFDALGVHDVVAKSVGSSNPYNMVRATFDALKGEYSPKMIANKSRQVGCRHSRARAVPPLKCSPE